MSNTPTSTQAIEIYRIRVLHPIDWLVQFNPVLHPQHGSFDLFEPSERREAAVTILWRPLKNLRGDGGELEDLTHRLGDHRQQVIANLDRSFKKREIISSRELACCDHHALEDRISASYARGIFRKQIRLTRIQRILICTETERILSVYGSCLEKNLQRWKHHFDSVFNSFHCHHQSGSI